MAYKVNGTTVVDNSRNVTACCVTSCCITASSRMDIPSGNTASRPGSPATGSLFFDTDEGALIVYNGSDWAAAASGGGGVAKYTTGFDGDGAMPNCSFYTRAFACGNYCNCQSNSNGYCCFYTFRVPGSYFHFNNGQCTNRGNYILGADGSFAKTNAVVRVMQMGAGQSGMCRCSCNHSRQHVFYARNGCQIEFQDSQQLTTTQCCGANNNIFHCHFLNNECSQTDIFGQNIDAFYNLFVEGSRSTQGGYITFGKCPGGCVEAVVPYDSMANGLCQAYKIQKCVRHYAYEGICFGNSAFQSSGSFTNCGGNNAQVNVIFSLGCGTVGGAPYTAQIAQCPVCCGPQGQDCNSFAQHMPLGDLADPGMYCDDGGMLKTECCGSSGCFRYLIGVSCKINDQNCRTNMCLHAITNSTNTVALIMTSSGLSACSYCWSPESSGCVLDHCVNRVGILCQATNCFKTYEPFGCNCGGGSQATNPDCAVCFAMVGSHQTTSIGKTGHKGMFYNFINDSCFRVTRVHDTFANCGPDCCLYVAQTTYNFTTMALVCSYQYCTLYNLSGVGTSNQPIRHSMLAYDENSCRALWNFYFQDTNRNCRWAYCGIGFAVTKFDNSNHKLCLLDYVKFGFSSCSRTEDYGIWAGGSICSNCCSKKVCCIICAGLGVHVNRCGDFIIARGGVSDSGCDKCHIQKVARCAWACSAFSTSGTNFRLCCMFGSQGVTQSTINMGTCSCTRVDCKHPKFCSICNSSGGLGNFSSSKSTNRTCVCSYPDLSTTGEGFCMCKCYFMDDAMCWLDRKSGCCRNGEQCTGAVHNTPH